MTLIMPVARAALIATAVRSAAEDGFDPPPVVKLFSPIGPARWLATELLADDDILFGLADLGFGCPELGYFSLPEIMAVRLPLGLRIACDTAFATDLPLSRWAEAARVHGSIRAAEAVLASRDFPSPELPPGLPDG